MKTYRFICLLVLTLVMSGCVSTSGFYLTIKGKVVNAETGQPLEGALVVAQWYRQVYFGYSVSDVILSVERVTDKNGDFKLDKTPNTPFIAPPTMLIYKEGYIPWRNDSVFPGGRRTKDYEWNDNVTYKLDAFSNKYTFRQLFDFMDYGIRSSGGRETPIFDELMRKIHAQSTAEIKKQMQNSKRP